MPEILTIADPRHRRGLPQSQRQGLCLHKARCRSQRLYGPKPHRVQPLRKRLSICPRPVYPRAHLTRYRRQAHEANCRLSLLTWTRGPRHEKGRSPRRDPGTKRGMCSYPRPYCIGIRADEYGFPRITLLGSSLNKRAATIRPRTGVAISRARVSNTYYA